MDYLTTTYRKKIDQKSYSCFVLGADLGGTNANLAIAGVKRNKERSIEPLDMIFAAHFPSKELKSIIPAFKEVLSEARNNYDITVSDACIGAAGPAPVDAHFVKMSNASWNVNTQEIIRQTSLKSILLINDFQAIGFALNKIFKNAHKDSEGLITVQKGSRPKADSERGTKAVLGGGTGLGACILVYDAHKKSYSAIGSEISQSDFAAHTKEELEFAESIRKKRDSGHHLTLDETISGRGIVSIYGFLRKKRKFPATRYTHEIDATKEDDKAALISKYRKKDRVCKETFSIFAGFYGRVAKNFILCAMAFGGLYLAGGIAVKNPEIFKSREFRTGFAESHKYAKLLKTIPIYIIEDYDISLYGACYAAMQAIDK